MPRGNGNNGGIINNRNSNITTNSKNNATVIVVMIVDGLPAQGKYHFVRAFEPQVVQSDCWHPRSIECRVVQLCPRSQFSATHHWLASQPGPTSVV